MPDTSSINETSAPTSIGPNSVINDSTGSTPKINESTLEPENRSIASVDQAFQVCESMVNDWKKGIINSAKITAKLNGERPHSQSKLKAALKDWKSNISTGFLATECAKVTPRLFMPLKTAKYLTAASLPAGWPGGESKTRYFRERVTKAVRSWKKFNLFIRGLAREVGTFGFAFSFWPDEYEWRPMLIRMDRGFVPQGTEIAEEPAFFMAKVDYKPNELLDLLRRNVEAERSEWKKDAVVKAITAAFPVPVDATYPQARKYEELIRQATWGYFYEKGVKVIRTYHLFSKEASGSVSHYVLWYDGKASDADSRLLYENLDQYPSMDDAVNATVFEYGDGTVHGSWGAGQILYDLSVSVEKIRNDSIDNLRQTNKLKIQVAEGKDMNDVKTVINDSMVIVAGGTFTGNTAALPQNVDGYQMLDDKLTQLAQQKIGAFVPAIPLQPSDIKAAQINAAVMKEKELQEAMLENWLIQWANGPMRTMTRRLCNPDNPDKDAQELMADLANVGHLTMEEIALLVNQMPVQSVMQFTEYEESKRAAFAMTVVNNPLFKQDFVARTMAAGAGDESFVAAIVVPDGDQSSTLAAQNDQKKENAAMAIGQQMAVLPTDNDWVHMQTMKPGLQSALQAGNHQVAEIGLQHYAAHWNQGVAKKSIPPDQINNEKSFIAAAEKIIEQLKVQENLKKIAAGVVNTPQPVM